MAGYPQRHGSYTNDGPIKLQLRTQQLNAMVSDSNIHGRRDQTRSTQITCRHRIQRLLIDLLPMSVGKLLRLEVTCETHSKGSDHKQADGRRHRNGQPMAFQKPTYPLGDRRCSGSHSQVAEMTLHVIPKRVGTGISPRPILLERLHDDPIEVATKKVTKAARVAWQT